ncbi:S41 family peptidase [Aquella oligotrophica]|uniref:Peptidase S41 n=1 Tax=Aquella oligotrophica TaxID=2067065 RepID=A0A2I7N6S6_9NEIS|nr:S41 family peptidase [Aquella oligotrophica]AUR52140.1 peptidase S41 [Aquella oligotrophica]
MKLKTISKFVLGAVCGSLLTISIYATADDNGDAYPMSSGRAGSIPVDEVNNFARVYAIAKNYYVESVTDTKLMKGAINGMLSNLDPHSDYLDAEDFKQLSEMTAGSFAGLGIEVSRDKGDGVKVVAPIYGTPAYVAGIKSGDLIVKIDDTPVSGLSLDDAIKRMRGKAGTKVRLSVVRASELKPLSFTITRANIQIKSVKSAMLAPDYGYVRITNFQADTTNELANTLNKLYKADPNLKGIVLDLRDDPGGLLQSAVGVSGVFLPKDSLVVYTDGRLPSSRQKFFAKPADYDIDGTQEAKLNSVPPVFKTLPMVVLVNQGTASASEIVSGALQDYKRAKILGTKTFGKGSVQTVIPLSSDTAVKLTTALYYTPKGRSIQAEGIKPDIIIQSEYDDLFKSWDMSEASLDKHIDNPLDNGKTKSAKTDSSVPVIRPTKQIATQAELKAKMNAKLKQQPKVVDQSQAQVNLNDDFQLMWALNILEGKPLPASATAQSSSKKTK